MKHISKAILRNHYARQGIRTRYLGPTNHRGARIIARCEAGRITVPYDSELDVYENHAHAAGVLLTKLGWHEHNELYGSSYGEGYFFGLIQKENKK